MRVFANEMKELKRPDEPLYKTPKSVQQTIDVQRVSENGIFQLSNTRYSMTYITPMFMKKWRRVRSTGLCRV